MTKKIPDLNAPPKRKTSAGRWFDRHRGHTLQSKNLGDGTFRINCLSCDAGQTQPIEPVLKKGRG